jgi:hypothetical protein
MIHHVLYETPKLGNRDTIINFYKIKYRNKTLNSFDSNAYYKGGIHYPKMNVKSDSLIISLIDELYKFKGDKRICLFATRRHRGDDCTNFHIGTQDIYMIDSIYGRYSLQLEALYLMEQLYYKDSFNELPYPIICKRLGDKNPTTDNVVNSCNSIDGELLKEAYNSVERWLEVAKREKKIPKKSPVSFDDSCLFWYNKCWSNHLIKELSNKK